MNAGEMVYPAKILLKNLMIWDIGHRLAKNLQEIAFTDGTPTENIRVITYLMWPAPKILTEDATPIKRNQ
nr:hypothetical protein [Desulfitobacterium hafniense]